MLHKFSEIIAFSFFVIASDMWAAAFAACLRLYNYGFFLLTTAAVWLAGCWHNNKRILFTLHNIFICCSLRVQRDAKCNAMQFHSVYMWQEERCTEHKSTDGSWLSCNNSDKRVESWSDYIVMEQSIISRNSVVLQQCKWQLSSSEEKKIDSNLSSQFEIFLLSAAVALHLNSKCRKHSRQP